MSFYIGQRVRIVYKSPRNGCEATITEIGEGFNNGKYVSLVYFCHVDGWGSEDVDGVRWGYQPGEIEPLIPPGLESIEEINQLYEPSSVFA